MDTNAPPRVRFAPSPTGYLHVGGARTALFNWLFARAGGGTVVLRIEDTDRERSSDEMTQAILHGMSWLGLDWDEGPLHQAEGTARHRQDALRLLADGTAYRCFCAPDNLAEKRKASGDAYRYDRACGSLDRVESDERAAAGQAHTVRFRVPAGVTSWDDVVHGTIEFANTDIEDFIILRSDGTPIYNMAVVSDDAHMRITHVIRGADHISNTPKQILLYRGLGFALPVFAHVPLILGPDGRRLSKRHGATAVGEYEVAGMLPDALVNFLALLGWSPGTDDELFSRAELMERFTLEGINRKAAVFDPVKLSWLNGQYLSLMPGEQVWPLLLPLLKTRGLINEAQAEHRLPWLLRLVNLLKVRSRTLVELADQTEPYIRDEVIFDPSAEARHWKDAAQTLSRLRAVRAAFASLESWSEAELETSLRALAEEKGVGAGKLIHPLRVALTGLSVSPGIFEVAVLLGRDRVLERTDAAIRRIESGEAGADGAG